MSNFRLLPFSPIRETLYTGSELLNEFDKDDPGSFTRTLDFQIYKHFVINGSRDVKDPYVSMMQSLHDNSINQAIDRFKSDRRVIGVMGGHNMARDEKAYIDIVSLSRRLTRSGFIMCSGGAIGAMEACHLGAALADCSDSFVHDALGMIGNEEVKTWPKKYDFKQIDPIGNVNQDAIRAIHKWFCPVFSILESIEKPGQSLAIPTWHYGFEPPTPFASHIAKYFQNSIREDGLVAFAKQGVVFAPGSAGTLQEIFQDAAQNKYKSFEFFSPMIFFGKKCWISDYPVGKILAKLFTKEEFKENILFTDSVDKVASFLENWP